MPYKDVTTRRVYDRERRRNERAGIINPSPRVLPAEMRLKVAGDVASLLEHAVALIDNDNTARDIERGKALAGIAGSALKLVEVSDISARLDRMELALGK